MFGCKYIHLFSVLLNKFDFFPFKAIPHTLLDD